MADGDNKVYVFDDGANKHEGMTKSEIMDTIVEMMETGQVTGGIYIDAVKEQNAGESLKFWVGTQAQYEALPEIDPYIDYKITDANTLQEIDAALTQLKEQLTSGAFKVKSAYTADDVQTSINGKAISEIFESDGKTAKKATIATADENGNNIMASYALKDDLQDAEGDIDALEGRMTTAEGDIDALEGRMTTAEGDIDALLPTSVTNTHCASGQWAVGAAAGAGTYLIGTFNVYDSNIHLKISGGISTSTTDDTTDAEVFISVANHIVNKAVCFANKLYTTSTRTGIYYTIDSSYNLRIFAPIPQYGKLFISAEVTGCTIAGKGASQLQYPSGGQYIPEKNYADLSQVVRVDAEQSLTDAQKQQARQNIDALGFIGEENPDNALLNNQVRQYFVLNDTAGNPTSGAGWLLSGGSGSPNYGAQLYLDDANNLMFRSKSNSWRGWEKVFKIDPSKLKPSTANGWTQISNTGSLPSTGVYLISTIGGGIGILVADNGWDYSCLLPGSANDYEHLNYNAGRDEKWRRYAPNGQQIVTTAIYYKRIA